jgi:hypothetical protein
VLEAAFCTGHALVQCLSRSIQYNWLVLGTSISPPLPFLRLLSSSLTLRQPLAPSIDKKSDAVLAAACTYKCTPHPPAAPFLEYSSSLLTDSRSQTKYHAAPTPRSPSSRPCAMRRQWAFISDMYVLRVTHACAGSEWRGQCDGDATWYGDDDVACSGGGVWSPSILPRGHRARRRWMYGREACVRRCVSRPCAGWMQQLRAWWW